MEDRRLWIHDGIYQHPVREGHLCLYHGNLAAEFDLVQEGVSGET